MKTLNLFVLYEFVASGYNIESLSILTILAIFTGILVIITKNPIISVLYLIGLFIVIAVYLILIGFSFLGLAYLLVYVGAVSILFLFILMLINVRISELVSETKNSIPLVFITTLSFSLPITDITNNRENLNKFYDLFFLYINNKAKDNTIFSLSSNKWDGNMVSYNHINSIGNIIYTSHNIWLILVSIILLLAMVGTIVITLKNKEKSINMANNKIISNYYKSYINTFSFNKN